MAQQLGGNINDNITGNILGRLQLGDWLVRQSKNRGYKEVRLDRENRVRGGKDWINSKL